MTRKRLGLVIVVSVCGLAAALAVAKRRPCPPFAGNGLPTPPAQHHPWTPPGTDVPEDFVTIAGLLFEHGMADPRGCEYREVEIGAGDLPLGDGGVVATHAWLLPREEGGRQPFAVCWNGLVYPVISVGEEADVRSDILAAIGVEERRQAERAAEVAGFYSEEMAQAFPEVLSNRWWRAEDEPTTVSHRWITSLKAPMLLRLSDGQLARRVWRLWRHALIFADNDKPFWQDPYLVLVTDWTWAVFDRLINAYVRGDDRLALLSARRLLRIRDDVDVEARSRGLSPGHALLFAEQVPALVADLQRRAEEPARSGVGQSIRLADWNWGSWQAAQREWQADLQATYPNREARIAALVEELDQLSVAQGGQPGWVVFAFDPTVLALISEGKEAIQPLLKCLETDSRLTRSVEYWRDFARQRRILGVERPAWEALRAILQGGFFEQQTYLVPQWKGRQAAVAEIRGILRKHTELTPEQRGAAVQATLDFERFLEQGDAAQVRLLLERYPDLSNLRTLDERPVLSVAALHGHVEVVETLLARGADISARTSSGATALHWPASAGKVAVVRALLDAGIEANARDDRGRTALHEAAREGQKQVVELLCGNGARIGERDGHGMTALDYAVSRGHDDVAAVLEAKAVETQAESGAE